MKRKLGIAAAAGLAALLGGCAAREANINTEGTPIAADNSPRIERELTFEYACVDNLTTNVHFYVGFVGNELFNKITYQNIFGKTVMILVNGMPENYETSPMIRDIVIDNRFMNYFAMEDPLKGEIERKAQSEWLEKCRGISCIETYQEWESGRVNLLL